MEFTWLNCEINSILPRLVELMDKGAMVDALKQRGAVKKAVFSLELSTGPDADLIVKGYHIDQGAQLVLGTRG